MPRVAELAAVAWLAGSVLLAGGAMLPVGVARAEPLPKVRPQPSSMTPEQAMQMNGLPPTLPRAQVLSFDDAIARSLSRNPSATVAMEEVARARAIVEEVRS